MRQKYKKIDYTAIVSESVDEDYKIGDDVVLLDEYTVDPVSEYEFISKGNTFIEVLEGEGSITMNGKEFPVNGHSLIVYLQGQKILTTIQSHKTVQRGVIFSNSFMESLYNDAIRADEIRYSIMENPVIPINETTASGLQLYVKVLREIAAGQDCSNKQISARFATLSLYYWSLKDLFQNTINTEPYMKPRVSARFFDLLKVHFREEHELVFYAQKMNISRQYLHVCVLTTSGKAPGYWVDRYLVSEAKKILATPGIMICKVSEMLHFSGSKQFGRFFKQNTGMTPMEYRVKVNNPSAFSEPEI